jgi:RNA polymerase sigma-70 factor (ECF subfamily)
LLRTAINQCKDTLKHWWRKTSNIDDHQDIEAGLSQEIELIEDRRVLDAVMALPERFKDVILLYYYGGYRTAEIAKMLHKPHSTIRYHMSEARRLLKDVLEDEE